MEENALVIDDDFLMRGFAVDSLKKQGLFVVEASTAAEANQLMEYRHFDFVFVDLKIMESVRSKVMSSQNTLMVVVTSFNTVDRAIIAVHDGAYDYIVKPFSSEQVDLVISRARQLIELKSQIAELENQMKAATFMIENSEVPTMTASFQTNETITNNLQELERETILRVMDETNGRRAIMADILGISVRTLRNKLTQYKQENLISD